MRQENSGETKRNIHPSIVWWDFHSFDQLTERESSETEQWIKRIINKLKQHFIIPMACITTHHKNILKTKSDVNGPSKMLINNEFVLNRLNIHWKKTNNDYLNPVKYVVQWTDVRNWPGELKWANWLSKIVHWVSNTSQFLPKIFLKVKARSYLV